MQENDYIANLINHVLSGKIEPNDSGTYKKCYIFPDKVVLKYKDLFKPLNPSERQKSLAQLKCLGFKTPASLFYSIEHPFVYEVQERALGRPLMLNQTHEKLCKRQVSEDFIKNENKKNFLELLSTPDSQFGEFFKSFYIGFKMDLLNDIHSYNVLYDKEKGFTFIDLPNVITNYGPLENFKREIEKPIMNKLAFKTFFYRPFFNDFPDNHLPIIYNLFGHKTLSGILSSDFKYAKNNIEEIRDLLIGNNQPNSLSKSCTDQLAKLYLCSSGLLEPTKKEKELLDFIKSNNDLKNLPFEYQSFNKHDNNFKDKTFFYECIKSTHLYGMTALDYYNQIECDLDLNNILSEDNLAETSM